MAPPARSLGRRGVRGDQHAAATLAGAVVGPFLVQWAGLAGLAGAASLVTFGAAVLARLTVPLRPVSGLPPNGPGDHRIPGKRSHW
jgi:hypothetical protein